MSDISDKLTRLATQCESGSNTETLGSDFAQAAREAAAEIEELHKQRDTLASIARKIATLKDESKPGLQGYTALAITVKRMTLLERVDEIAGKAVE